MLITFAGPDIEQSFTLFMFSLYFVSFFDWCVGSVIPPNEEQRLKGMTGYNCQYATFLSFFKKFELLIKNLVDGCDSQFC